MGNVKIEINGHTFIAKTAFTFLSRFRGLMFQQIEQDTALLIKPCNEIHCFNMLAPIDVVYLDKNTTVAEICERMKPWTVGKVIKKCYMVLELAPNKIQEYKIKKGDTLKIQRIKNNGKRSKKNIW